MGLCGLARAGAGGGDIAERRPLAGGEDAGPGEARRPPSLARRPRRAAPAVCPPPSGAAGAVVRARPCAASRPSDSRGRRSSKRVASGLPSVRPGLGLAALRGVGVPAWPLARAGARGGDIAERRPLAGGEDAGPREARRPPSLARRPRRAAPAVCPLPSGVGGAVVRARGTQAALAPKSTPPECIVLIANPSF